jgi:hypothetical protein
VAQIGAYRTAGKVNASRAIGSMASCATGKKRWLSRHDLRAVTVFARLKNAPPVRG